MYDLEPVRLSKRSAYVRFTDAMVEKLSSQRHLRRPAYAARARLRHSRDTGISSAKTRDFLAAVQAAGKPAELIVGENYNHFEFLRRWRTPMALPARDAATDGACARPHFAIRFVLGYAARPITGPYYPRHDSEGDMTDVNGRFMRANSSIAIAPMAAPANSTAAARPTAIAKPSAAMQIDKGQSWRHAARRFAVRRHLPLPGPIHEGKGEAAVVIDERASPAQREALLRILTGQDTEPGQPSSRCSRRHSKSCTSRSSPPSTSRWTSTPAPARRRGRRHRRPRQPIKNPVTGDVHSCPHRYAETVLNIRSRRWGAAGPRCRVLFR